MNGTPLRLSTTPAPATAKIIAFPSNGQRVVANELHIHADSTALSGPNRGDRLTLRDRSEALGWLEKSGYGRLAFDIRFAEHNAELGDFMLIYQRDASWSCWGIGCTDGGFMVWRPATSATIGWYPGLAQALAVIPAPAISTRQRRAMQAVRNARIA